ncbi:nitroreductase/quinone reductase family protein [Fodinicola feengrottensis]|uniref:Nitroreductase/quinone reductase family protein n=1 Tax=Fodinicola feengrottensis TaxID=435914 RepID=A0ABN2GFQ8_9ACTN
MLLLTTTGARSGAKRTTPLVYLPDGGERILVIGSAGGAPRHPAWFHNLVAHPRATVENGVFTYQAAATVLEGAERDQIFTRAAQANPGWADYQAKTSRVIPVIALKPVSAGPPNTTLKGIHDAFRRELSLVRQEIADSGPTIGAQLRVNCLTVCQGLHLHHAGEEAGIFPQLVRRFPEVEPAIDRLRVEHEKVAALVDELRAAIASDRTDRPAVLAEVDRLIDELERHLTYEEEQLMPLLG